eukprot:COSAG01_NODE_869_length_13031_cov_28.329467_8_plen_59_part_00
MPKFTELQDLPITNVIGVLKAEAPCSPKQPMLRTCTLVAAAALCILTAMHPMQCRRHP